MAIKRHKEHLKRLRQKLEAQLAGGPSGIGMPTESMNDLIKRINRIGFRRFSHHRIRVLNPAAFPEHMRPARM